MSVVVKTSFQNSLRRFVAPTDSFASFYAAIESVLQVQLPFRVSYVDTDGDSVVFDSTDELAEAVVHGTSNNVLRIDVELIQVKQTEEKQQETTVVGSSSNEKINPTKAAKKLAKQEVKLAKLEAKQGAKLTKLEAKQEVKLTKLEAKQEAKLAKQGCKAAKLELKADAKAAKQDWKAAKQEAQALVRAAATVVAAQQQCVRAAREALLAAEIRTDVDAELRATLKQALGDAKSQLAAKRQELVAARESLRALIKGGAPAVECSGGNDAAATNVLALAKQRFLANGLAVEFILPRVMAELKASGKGAFQAHRRALEAEGVNVLMPAFVRRVRALADVDAVHRLVDNKSKVLLAKGKGDVSECDDLAEQRAAMAAKQAELERVRGELRAMRQRFKASALPTATDNDNNNDNHGNTPSV